MMRSTSSALPAWLARWLAGCLLLALLAGGTARAAAEPLLLQDGTPIHDVWPVVAVLADPSRALSVQDALAQASRFEPHAGTRGTLGVRKDAVWLRIPVMAAPTSDGIWVLDIDYPVLNRVEVYLTTGGYVSQQATLGNLQAFSQRPLRSRSHALALQMQPGRHYDLLLRVETRGAMVLPITLSKPTAWHKTAIDKQMLQGIQTGLALCLLIYSLAQWINLREALFIQYALLITGSLLFSMHLFGLGTQYLWQEYPWFEVHAAGLAALTATCGSFLFISQALVGDRPRSRLLRAMRGGAVLCAVLGVMHALDILSTAAIAGIVTILGLVPALMGIPGSIRKARQADPIGASLLLAWLVYFVATATVIGVIRGWVPVNFWTLHSFHVWRDAGHAALHAGAGPAHQGTARAGPRRQPRTRRDALARTHRSPYRLTQPARAQHSTCIRTLAVQL